MQAKVEKVIFDFAARADVAVPLLEFSSKVVSFEHHYTPAAPHDLITQVLTVKNISKLPLSTALKTSTPFTLSTTAIDLAAEESFELTISMDPNYKHDFLSQSLKQKLAITYANNPQKDSVQLLGSINFPNAVLSAAAIDFGAVLNDTHKTESLTVTNSSAVPLRYRWTFADADASHVVDAADGAKAAGVPVNQLFDLLPIEGLLQPGQQEVVSFTYFAYPGQKASAQVILLVEGGPQYAVQISAEANSMRFTLEPSAIACGTHLYNKVVDKEVVLTNPSR